MTTAKNEPFLVYNMKIVFSGGDKPLVEVIKIWSSVYWGRGGGGWFCRGEGIKSFKHIVQKHVPVNLQNLLDG